jgi:hypothetical protein
MKDDVLALLKERILKLIHQNKHISLGRAIIEADDLGLPADKILIILGRLPHLHRFEIDYSKKQPTLISPQEILKILLLKRYPTLIDDNQEPTIQLSDIGVVWAENETDALIEEELDYE